VTKIEAGKLATGVAKFLEPVTEKLIEQTGAADGDLLCFGVSSKPNIVHRTLGELRVRLGKQLKLIDESAWRWLWVVDFPAFGWNEQEKRWDSLHHPFTAPRDEDLDKLESDTAGVLSEAYDLVLNGSELGGGSVRIHRRDVQSRVFKLLGIGDDEAQEKFGFLLDALQFGAPPHGGIALGLDRIVMHLCGTTNIRDVIAFPKTQAGADLMTAAPSPVDDKQLRELHLRLAPGAAIASP
jgi:aspartyl-tRNA synthetase